MTKLGFTFYPKDWWTSDTYFELEPIERYIYLECLFLMYQNNGYLSLTREKLETRIRTQIKPKIWEKITQRLNLTNLGYTHESVKKRTTKAYTSRENGKLGGRPRKPNNPLVNLPLEYKEKENIKGKGKENINIPSFDIFLDYSQEKIIEYNLTISETDLKMKYDSWVENGWKTGGKKPRKIVNWKTTLLNTLKYLNHNEKQERPQKTAASYNRNDALRKLHNTGS